MRLIVVLFVPSSLIAAPTMPSPSPTNPPADTYSYYNGQTYGPWYDGRDLGDVSFTVSESVTEAARESFITGLKLLHAFEYPEARAAFREAQEMNMPNRPFIMALWGEFMCNFQLLWFTKDYHNAEQVLVSLKQARQDYQGHLSTSEIILLDAAERLVNNENDSRSKLPHETGSNEQLFYQSLNQAFSGNTDLEPEIRVFRNLAWLATRDGILDSPLERRVISDLDTMRLDPVWANHPGVHHYLIHASESPRLTREYLAPSFSAAQWLRSLSQNDKDTSSIHLTHMPAHFYFAMGDWVNASQVNDLAWNKSLDRARDLNLSDASLAYHPHLWRNYSLLQASQYDAAISDNRDLYQRLQQLVSNGASDDETRVLRTYYAFEHAFLTLELPSSQNYLFELAGRELNINRMSGWGLTAHHFSAAWQALQDKQYVTADSSRNALNALLLDSSLILSAANIDAIPVMVEQLKAEEQRQRGDLVAAIRLAKAVESDYRNMRWDHGVPLVVKPLLEYLGDLEVARYKELHSNGYQPVSVDEPVTTTLPVVPFDQNLADASIHYQAELAYNPRRKKTLTGLYEIAQLGRNLSETQVLQGQLNALSMALDYHQLLALYYPASGAVQQPSPTPSPEPDSANQITVTVLSLLLFATTVILIF